MLARMQERLDTTAKYVRSGCLSEREMEAVADNLYRSMAHLTGCASATDRQAMLIEAVETAAERTLENVRARVKAPSHWAAHYVLEELWWYGPHREAGMILGNPHAFRHFQTAVIWCVRGKRCTPSANRQSDGIERSWLGQLSRALSAVGQGRSVQSLAAARRGFRKGRSLSKTREKLSST